MTVTLEVGLAARRYPIRIGNGLLDDAKNWRATIRGGHALIVSDGNVAPLHAQRLRDALLGFPLPPGEAERSERARSAG